MIRRIIIELTDENVRESFLANFPNENIKNIDIIGEYEARIYAKRKNGNGEIREFFAAFTTLGTIKIMRKNYVGMKWKELSESEKEELLSMANAVDGRTGNNMKESRKCIVDLGIGYLSVLGYIEITEDENIISVEDDAVIHDSRESIPD